MTPAERVAGWDRIEMRIARNGEQLAWIEYQIGMQHKRPKLTLIRGGAPAVMEGPAPQFPTAATSPDPVEQGPADHLRPSLSRCNNR